MINWRRGTWIPPSADSPDIGRTCRRRGGGRNRAVASRADWLLLLERIRASRRPAAVCGRRVYDRFQPEPEYRRRRTWPGAGLRSSAPARGRDYRREQTAERRGGFGP